MPRCNKRERTDQSQATPLQQKRVKLSLPRELKEQLVADWEQITLEPRKWVPVPRRPSVRDVVDEFVASRSRDSRWAQFGEAVVVYFDKALPKILLYRYEREQFQVIKAAHPNAAPSTLFGAEHLVRLFAKLPELLCQTRLAPADLQQTKTKLTDLFKWLVKNKARLFLAHYELREAILNNGQQRGSDHLSSSPDDENACHAGPIDQPPGLDQRQQQNEALAAA